MKNRLISPRLYSSKTIALRQVITDSLFYVLLSAYCLIAVHNDVVGDYADSSLIALLVIITAVFVSDVFIFNIVEERGVRVCYGRGLGLFFVKPIAFWAYLTVTSCCYSVGNINALIICMCCFTAVAICFSALCVSAYFKDTGYVYVDCLAEKVSDAHDPLYIIERLIVSAICVAGFSLLGPIMAVFSENAVGCIIIFTFASFSILAFTVELAEFILALKHGKRSGDE